jgi:hypothetical protein
VERQHLLLLDACVADSLCSSLQCYSARYTALCYAALRSSPKLSLAKYSAMQTTCSPLGVEVCSTTRLHPVNAALWMQPYLTLYATVSVPPIKIKIKHVQIRYQAILAEERLIPSRKRKILVIMWRLSSNTGGRPRLCMCVEVWKSVYVKLKEVMCDVLC